MDSLLLVFCVCAFLAPLLFALAMLVAMTEPPTQAMAVRRARWRIRLVQWWRS